MKEYIINLQLHDAFVIIHQFFMRNSYLNFTDYEKDGIKDFHSESL